MTMSASFSRRSMALLIATALLYSVDAFTTLSNTQRRPSLLRAAPKRLEENVDGVLYVNDKV